MKLDPKEKFYLFKKNKNFCSVPWNLLYVDAVGKIKVCVRNQTVLGDLHDSSLDTILTGSEIVQIKNDMFEDRPVPSCSKCLRKEQQIDSSTSYKFLRNLYNEMFVGQDVDYKDATKFSFSALDLHWSSICDLKCVTCWAPQSSSLAVEQGIPVKHIDSRVVSELIDKFVDNQHELKEIYFSGGEPTLIKQNLALLRRLDKRPDLQIRVNSNMMWQQDNSIVQEILKFPNVLFTCSADNTKDKFEYIRRGARWDRFLDNLKFLSAQPNVRIRINLVFFVLSALDLIDTIDFFSKEYQIKDFTINQCEMEQTHLRCRNLSTTVKEKVISNIEQAKNKYAYNLNLLGQFSNCLVELAEPSSEGFAEYFCKIDSLADSNFEHIFPELL
jgi:sulfatase maturation enzyme AslB (radical SAM superfamily)